MRTILASEIVGNPFPECSVYQSLSWNSKVPPKSTRCYSASNGVYFRSYSKSAVTYVSIYNEKKKKYEDAEEIKHLGDYSAFTVVGTQPALLKVVNDDENYNFTLKYEEIYTSNDEYKNYYGSRNAVKDFELKMSKDSFVRLFYIPDDSDATVTFKNDPASYNVTVNGYVIESPYTYKPNRKDAYYFAKFTCSAKDKDTPCTVAITIKENCGDSCRSHYPEFLDTLPAKSRVFSFNDELSGQNHETNVALAVGLTCWILVMVGIIVGIILCCNFCACCAGCCCYSCCHCRKDNDEVENP